MKELLRIYLVLIALALSVSMVSCFGVTETSNPTAQGEPLFAPDGAARELYENENLGVEISYPDTWTFVEGVDEAVNGAAGQEFVEFMSEEYDDGTTTATVFFEILDPAPSSLFAYLYDTFTDRDFQPFATTTLSGFVYDDPATGPNGGDLEEYYFLDVDLLIHIEAEVFPSARPEFNSFLEGISFQQVNTTQQVVWYHSSLSLDGRGVGVRVNHPHPASPIEGEVIKMKEDII